MICAVPLSLYCSLLVGKYQHTSTLGLAASSDTCGWWSGVDREEAQEVLQFPPNLTTMPLLSTASESMRLLRGQASTGPDLWLTR